MKKKELIKHFSYNVKSDKDYLEWSKIPFNLSKVKQGHWVKAIVTIPHYITKGKWYINGKYSQKDLEIHNYDLSRYDKDDGGFWIGNPDDGLFYAVQNDEYWHFDLNNVMPFNPKNKQHILFFTEPKTFEDCISDTQGGLIDYFAKHLNKIKKVKK